MLLTDGQIAQLVEQGTENPCVSGSIPLLATIFLFPKVEAIPLKIPQLSGSIPLLATIFIAVLYSIFLFPHNFCWTIINATELLDMFCQLQCAQIIKAATHNLHTQW